MQRVVAYRLERRDLRGERERRTAAFDEVVAVLEEWLREKGAQQPGEPLGTFTSKTQGADGSFRWERGRSDVGAFATVHLEEDAAEYRRFHTSIWAAESDDDIVVFASLSSGASFSTVSPTPLVLPHCPKVVRSILKLSSEWHHGDTRIEGLRLARGGRMGKVLADAIRSPQRALPIVLVTEDDGEVLLRRVDEDIARDLVGVASVWRADEQAAWEITKELGPPWACYFGAVRIYWPQFDAGQPYRRHRRWPPQALLDAPDEWSAKNRLRTQMRQEIFRAAAANVLRPAQLDVVRRACDRARIQALRDQLDAGDGDDYRELADAYADDNELLRRELQERQDEISALKTDLANAEARLEHSSNDHTGRPDEEQEPAARDSGPKRGEIRFYKKTTSTPKRDRMVLVTDCGHNKWEGATKADKAKKGIISFEQRDDFKGMWHCASCTGGGMWKVKW